MTSHVLLSGLPGHHELAQLADRLQSESVEQLFAEDPGRAAGFCIEAAGLRLDYSKQLIDRAALSGLAKLAEQAGLTAAIVALFDGEHVNNTEDRPALRSA